MARATAELSQSTTEPQWPTFVRARLRGDWRDGLVMGTDNSVWLYRAVPMSPVADAKTDSEIDQAAAPVMAMLDELAMMSGTMGGRRATARQSYRQFHALVVNLPQWWTPPHEHPMRDYLAASFPRTRETRKRVALIGVRLQDKVGGRGGLRAAVESIAETVVAGGTPLEDFEPDARRVAAAATRSGLTVPTNEQFRIANAWWNNGTSPDVYVVPAADCLHVFTHAEQARAAKRAMVERDVSWQEVTKGTTVTMAAVQDMDLPFVSSNEPRAWWVTQLVDNDALVVSVRGRIEPAKLTRAELRRNRKRNEEDIRDRAQANKMELAEQEEQTDRLRDVENLYANPGAPASVVEASIVVGFSGYVPDMTELSIGLTANLNPMLERQRAAMAETMIASNVRANPHLQDLPAQTLAYSGMAGLSAVGDMPSSKAVLFGFTERDKQPAWIEPMAASDADTLPIFIGAGATGSGKTQLLLWLADQYARLGTPCVIVDPKPGSDHSRAVQASGGTVYSLDDLTKADGAFDPLRFSATPAAGVEIAASMLMSINPWGSRGGDVEVDVIHALAYGVQHGAKTTGQAMYVAMKANQVDKSIVEPLFRLAQSSAMFRAMFGLKADTPGLRVAEGISYIKVGNANLDLPAPGAEPKGIPQRVALALVRMMVFGSATALTGRDGVVMLDEAWVFLGAGRDEIERLGRLARSQRVFPMLWTQRVTDALNAGLAGYISRGVILPIEDATEARAACELFKLEATDARLSRITAQGKIGEAGGGTAPNWSSMRALRDPADGTVLRGSIGIYSDLAKRAVPTEIALPTDWLRRASTNKADMDAREQAERAALEAMQARAGAVPPMDPQEML